VVVDGDAAAGVPLHQPRPVEGRDQEAVGWRMEDSQILRSPDGEHAQEASGGHCEMWEHYTLLKMFYYVVFM
jgi:hypothetical protein